MYPVYLITCIHPSYGQHPLRYVGCVLKEGKSIENRFKQHMRAGKASGAPYLSHAVHKHGKEWFTVEQIDAGTTPEDALWLERWWVKWLGTKAPYGYNLTDGGEGAAGYKPTSSARRYAGVTSGSIVKARAVYRAGDHTAIRERTGKMAVESGQLAQARACRTTESRVKVGGTIAHIRYHVKRGVTSPACKLCKAG